LAAELVRLNPSVIVSGPLPANWAVQKATSTIPIVMGTGADPVGFGLVKSLAHPGGNITGVSNFAEELASKQLDIMRELLPRLSRIGVLKRSPIRCTCRSGARRNQRQLRQASRRCRLKCRQPSQLETAFAVFARKRVDAWLVPPDTTFVAHHRRITELAASARLPAIYFNRSQVEEAVLMSYGPDLRENWRLAATYVERILKGANPADLPIEQPTKIELVINLKTAKALGLDIPQTQSASMARSGR
jgi:ABC-type uncharacterized transport system substrate-binding protein